MTVVLLDPRRPELIPVRALRLLGGPVAVTEDVPPAVLWQVSATAAAESDDSSVPLLSTDPNHPLVRLRIDGGDDVIAAAPAAGAALGDAVTLMDTLRRNGPWESRQTHLSLRRYLVEEVYELLDAIDAGSSDDLREELGDLLLQVLFHARIAADDPDHPFDINDVARSFVDKVSHRTPGVLSGAHADLETQIREWEERKAAEKRRGSVLDGIASTAPALALGQKVLERLEAADFPIDTIDAETTTAVLVTGGDSIEELMRQRIRALMVRVRDAERRAAADGVELDTREAWERYLG